MVEVLKSSDFQMLSDSDDDGGEYTASGGESPTKHRESRRIRREMRRLVSGGESEVSEGRNICAEGVVSAGDDADVAVPVVGMMSVSGRCREMEDSVCVKTALCRPEICGRRPAHFFGVYDGHGGAHVAALCKDRLHILLADELSLVAPTLQAEVEVGSSSATTALPNFSAAEEEGWWRVAAARCFQRMDDVALNTCVCGSFGFQCGCNPMDSSLTGSTAVVAVVTDRHIVVANVGDSRAVLCRGGTAIPLSFDHKPDRPDERARIEASGGRVIYLNGARVEGILAMSRALGDKYLKEVITSEPEITFTCRHPEDECLILASDGLWDVMSNELVCEVASECLRDNSPATAVPRAEEVQEENPMYPSRSASTAALLTRLALGRRSSDNISVIVVDLKRSSSVEMSHTI